LACHGDGCRCGRWKRSDCAPPPTTWNVAADWTAAWTLSIVLTAHRSSSCREGNGNGGAFDGAFDGVVDAAVSSGLEERPSEFGGAGNTLGRFGEGEADDELGGRDE